MALLACAETDEDQRHRPGTDVDLARLPGCVFGVTAAEDTLLVLLAGDPYGEDLLMFWNFVGESENAVRTAREEWEDQHPRARRYGVVEGYPGFEGEPTRAQIDRIPAPQMPSVKLRARRNR